MTSNILKENPLNLTYQKITEWVEAYISQEKELGHVLTKSAPLLLTTYYAKMVG